MRRTREEFLKWLSEDFTKASIDQIFDWFQGQAAMENVGKCPTSPMESVSDAGIEKAADEFRDLHPANRYRQDNRENMHYGFLNGARWMRDKMTGKGE